MDFIINWHDGIYRSKVIFSTIPTQRLDFEVKVIDLEVFAYYMIKTIIGITTVLPAKSDSDVMFCLQSYQGFRINISLAY